MNISSISQYVPGSLTLASSYIGLNPAITAIAIGALGLAAYRGVAWMGQRAMLRHDDPNIASALNNLYNARILTQEN